MTIRTGYGQPVLIIVVCSSGYPTDPESGFLTSPIVSCFLRRYHLVHRGLLEAVGAKKGRRYVLARLPPETPDVSRVYPARYRTFIGHLIFEGFSVSQEVEALRDRIV